MKHTYTLTALLLIAFGLKSQDAPDFTVTDVNGNQHNLYTYLGQGKTVLLDFYAVWCGPCENNAPAVEEFYHQYGPDGTGELVMLAIEADDATSDANAISTAQQWGATAPIINQDGGTDNMYNISGYPSYFMVCPDKSYQSVSGSSTTIKNNLEAAFNACPSASNLNNNATAGNVSGAYGSVCSSNVTPKVTIENSGQNDLTSVTIEYSIDNGTTNTYNWSGSLSTYEKEVVELPLVSGLSDGTHEFTYEIKNPNNVSDADASDNSKTNSFLVYSSGSSIVLEMETDFYFEEVSWDIKNANGVVLAEGNNLTSFFPDPSTICVNYECYTFNIYDSYGDGWSDGEATIKHNGETILTVTSDQHNLSTASFDFCIEGLATGTNDEVLSSPIIYPNPCTNILNIQLDASVMENQIEIYSISGALVYSNTISTTQFSIPVHFKSGMYTLRITNEKASFSQPIIVK